MFTAVPLVLKATVLDPRLIALIVVLLEDKLPAVTAYPWVLNVPLVTVKSFEPRLNASASCTVPP